MTLYLWHLPVLIALTTVGHALHLDRPVGLDRSGFPVPDGWGYGWGSLVFWAVYGLGVWAVVRLMWPFEHAPLPWWDAPPRSRAPRSATTAAVVACVGTVGVGVASLMLSATGLAGFPTRVLVYAGLPLNAAAAIALLAVSGAAIRWAGAERRPVESRPLRDRDLDPDVVLAAAHDLARRAEEREQHAVLALCSVCTRASSAGSSSMRAAASTGSPCSPPRASHGATITWPRLRIRLTLPESAWVQTSSCVAVAAHPHRGGHRGAVLAVGDEADVLTGREAVDLGVGGGGAHDAQARRGSARTWRVEPAAATGRRRRAPRCLGWTP